MKAQVLVYLVQYILFVACKQDKGEEDAVQHRHCQTAVRNRDVGIYS